MTNKHGVVEPAENEKEVEEPNNYDDDLYNPLDTFFPTNPQTVQRPPPQAPVRNWVNTFWPFGQRAFSVNVPVQLPVEYLPTADLADKSVDQADKSADQAGKSADSADQEVKVEKKKLGDYLEDLKVIKNIYYLLPNAFNQFKFT